MMKNRGDETIRLVTWDLPGSLSTGMMAKCQQLEHRSTSCCLRNPSVPDTFTCRSAQTSLTLKSDSTSSRALVNENVPPLDRLVVRLSMPAKHQEGQQTEEDGAGQSRGPSLKRKLDEEADAEVSTFI